MNPRRREQTHQIIDLYSVPDVISVDEIYDAVAAVNSAWFKVTVARAFNVDR